MALRTRSDIDAGNPTSNDNNEAMCAVLLLGLITLQCTITGSAMTGILTTWLLALYRILNRCAAALNVATRRYHSAFDRVYSGEGTRLPQPTCALYGRHLISGGDPVIIYVQHTLPRSIIPKLYYTHECPFQESSVQHRG